MHTSKKKSFEDEFEFDEIQTMSVITQSVLQVIRFTYILGEAHILHCIAGESVHINQLQSNYVFVVHTSHAHVRCWCKISP